ncbi:glucose-repressible alcohol dehydrogenase transcriptional effector [Durotheca rogersii]|uniref:glucose-repressible alcohol dehydrogenase transcriptional effector n=1 Tax=Durotheca rogersii TaxID=419775 RepID=UPI00222065EF|nr:glucose-repressible alcohol dehydrogenase transcriptional effector [Durotheca rogersii]KAI5865379.1 glucose-repressible alcohol dehydrogenase transcriptional effector [Durotheca rogersii]
MYAPNHQQAHNARLNGVPSNRGMAPQMIYNFVQPQGAHQPHAHPQQHHHALPQDHAAHTAASGTINHSAFSSGLMSSVTPFTPSSHQNGAAPGSRGGQTQSFSEHWNEQLKSLKESERAHATMTEQHQPHYFARLRANENKGIGLALPNAASAETAVDGELEDRGRPVNVDKALDRQDWFNIDFSGQGLKNISIMLFDNYAFLTEIYLASNNLTHLPREIGQLRSLKHLDVSHNRLTSLPPELGMCTPLKQLLLYNNLIQTIPSELGALHFLELLGIQGNPLEHEQKQRLMEEGTKALIAHLKEQAPVPMPPNPRALIPIQEDVGSDKEHIRVMSWNTLCDKYATSTQYGYTPASALSWEYRKESIMREFRERDVDILCLQETAMDAFNDFFTPELAKHGYEGVFYPKTRVKHLTGKDQQSVDGCSIFYKSEKYIMLDKQLVDFRQTAINRPDMKMADDVFNRVMPKDTIAVYCFFESRFTGNRFIVVNAHLCWESFLADVKAVQTGILMELVTKQSEKYTRKPPLPMSEKILPRSESSDGDSGVPAAEYPEPAPSQEYRNNTDIPLLVCGDYNSMADSSVYELLEKGRIPPDHPDLVGHSYGNFTRDGIEHPFSLRNAYAHLFGTSDELTFTNYTPTFSGVIDYIWYTTNTLDVVELLGPPDYEYLKRVPGFPNYHFPADHIQIMGDFVFKSRKEKKVAADQDRSGGSSRS